MNLLRALLIFGCLAICNDFGHAADSAPPILSFSRKAQTTNAPPAANQIAVGRQSTLAEYKQAAAAPADSPKRNPRLLAPPTREQIAAPGGPNALAARPRGSKFGLPKIESMATAAAGLSIVVGLFLVCMWLMRRSGPRPTSQLPSDAVAVLGRVPLAARNFAHLLQVGNKLVLVAITPEGVSPITEIADPVEVQRMLGLCLHNSKQSTTAEFHDVLQKLSKEPASGFLGNEVAASYASQGRA